MSSVKMAKSGAPPAGGSFDLDEALKTAATAAEHMLDQCLPRPSGLHARIHEAMRYPVFAGGKRLRPFLTMQSALLFGVPPESALRTAVAIEAVHTYSLVHDDLPCMDNDDLRRGRPTTHKAFDEATAVLAGDALLTIAFEILADVKTHPSADVRCKLVARLAQAAGADGMIGGQMIDMLAPTHRFGRDEIVLLQQLKTGALFEFCCEAGAILGGASADHRERMLAYARAFGLAFQISDDLLDVTSTAEKAGKSVGKDTAQGKATLVSIQGVAAARAEVKALAREAAALLEPYGPAADPLRALPASLLDRES
jgi:farnesyl diphosphate synthase